MNAQKIAYTHLKTRIMSGELPANSPIAAEEIGRALGISRMPVREALLQLEVEGLVTIGENRRTVVTALTQKDIVELFEIRVALECLAVERAVPRLTSEIFERLRRQVSRMDQAATNPKRWLQRHDEFHDLICEAADMPRLLQDIRRIRQSIQPYLFMYLNVYKIPEMPGAEHETLVGILKRRDPELARAAFAAHIRDAASAVVYFLMSGQRPAMANATAKARKTDEENAQ